MLTGSFRALTSLLLAACASPALSLADDYRSGREFAQRELAPYFGKQVAIQSTLRRTMGPEWAQNMFKIKLFGCPSESAAPPQETKELVFTTGGPGPWAGAVDGINVAIAALDGSSGWGLAVPSNSTARLPEFRNGPELEFIFDGTLDVRRSLVDAAAAEFDRCFRQLEDRGYSWEELMRLCPYRPVTRSEQKQSCVVSTRGTVGAPLANGTGFRVRFWEATVCDFVGFGSSGESVTSFTSCFINEYKGVARISAPYLSATPEQRRLLAAKRRITARCARTASGRRMRPAQVKSCVMREMARAMSVSQ